jgi:hypothetical protein
MPLHTPPIHLFWGVVLGYGLVCGTALLWRQRRDRRSV